MSQDKPALKSRPLVSVIIPVYNTFKYLGECLDSVINQTITDIEIICVNDGSIDNSPDLLKKYAKKDKRLTIIAQPNMGVISARNNGISKARGKYILPLDSDDKIAKNCIERLLDIIKTTDYSIISPGVEFFGAKTGTFNLPTPTAENMALGNCIVNCALFEKKYWEKYGGYDERFNKGIEDYDFWWNFLQDGKKIYRTDEILFFYRIRQNESSRTSETANYHPELMKLMHTKYSLMQELMKTQIYKRIYKFSKKLVRYALKMAKHITTIVYLKLKQLPNFLLRFKKIFLWRDYKNYVLNHQLDKSNFIPITNSPFSGKPKKKIIAYYLPQYYQIKQNDEWFGTGFTEWSNTTKATPQFTGHWQPHNPIDVGFYNLETTKVMHRQAELAKMYGIHGFCFYYYWFSGGDKIMEKPINNWLNDNSIDFPFMLFWANEDWTNTWGEKADIGTKTYSAKMKPSDIDKFTKDILPFLKDKRYITINGRPHIIIYQPRKDPYLSEFIKGIKKSISDNGLKEPYISLVFPDENPKDFNPHDYNADGAVEFGVHMKVRPDHIQKPLSNSQIVNPLAKIKIYDMEHFINNQKFLYDTNFDTHKGVMTTYDNTARKIYTGAYLFSVSPKLYEQWLLKVIETSKSDYVFITAWNEWAEGMHLEPDQKFGYAYLEATKNALAKSNYK